MAVQMLVFEIGDAELAAKLDRLAEALADDERYRPAEFARLLGQIICVPGSLRCGVSEHHFRSFGIGRFQSLDALLPIAVFDWIVCRRIGRRRSVGGDHETGADSGDNYDLKISASSSPFA